MAFESVDKVDQVTLATETGDDGTLSDKTDCMTDDSSSVSCIEIKNGQGARVEVNHAAEALSSVTIREGVQSVMATGTNRIAPYTDSNSIDDTNGVTTASISGAGDEDTAVSAAFITDAEQGNGKFIFRIFEDGSGAKTKVGEIDIEMTIATVDYAGITKDKDDVIVGSVNLELFRVNGNLLEKTGQTVVSNASTGAYSFTVDDDGAEYRVYGIKGSEWNVSDADVGV